ncbi:hypothetical protein B5K03_33635 [Rhizobium phaseoli]|uniref:hypothetical protein n=1 Tax=Rhizobium phaseoli TaxID=396 RepID=UPI000D682A5B|nr:hypothetical protein [Rhizobium phaseoli]PWI49885.1 hypothetical protein B5K03_33635 [Rhizobium phaseoli]
MTVRHLISTALAVLLMVSSGAFASAVAQEKLIAPETNPPGDIPDNQVFVTYNSPDGFDLKVPEGWSRTVIDHGVRFFDKYDEIDATVADASVVPTASSAKAHEVPDLKTAGHAVKVTAVKDVKLAAGPAVRISYVSNSAPNSVTSKQIRLEHERFILFREGKTVTLDLAAPAGADNVDQWHLISNSLKWR